jgi:hypothetical protein
LCDTTSAANERAVGNALLLTESRGRQATRIEFGYERCPLGIAAANTRGCVHLWLPTGECGTSVARLRLLWQTFEDERLRKNHLFCWSELGAKQLGILQSLTVTCKLHGINPYDYLVDVLQRVSRHPAKDVAALTPRRWKQRFADNPLRSDVMRCLNG